MAQPLTVGPEPAGSLPYRGAPQAPPPGAHLARVMASGPANSSSSPAAAATGWPRSGPSSARTSVMLRGGTTILSESTLHLLTWRYRASETATFSSAEWTTPPLLVVGLRSPPRSVLSG